MKIALILLAVLATAYGRSSRIIGGKTVQWKDYPYKVSLRRNGNSWWQHFCGGSIIGKNTVLTAAHCVTHSSRRTYYVQALVGGTERTYRVTKVSQYPSYDGGHELGTFHSDVAIMKLENADFGAANIIELAENDKEDYSNADADIVGWGKTSADGGVVEDLQMTPGKVFSNDDCQSKWGTIGQIYGGHICIDGEGASGSCSGDSGGAMITQKNGKPIQIGVTSWGYYDCRTSYPSVYARVSYFREWLDNEMAK